MTDTSRRDLFKGAAVTGLAAAAAPAFAQGAAPLADPQTRFVSTPFPEQRQKWPALQRDMRPVPIAARRVTAARGGWQGGRRWSPAAIRGSAARR